MTSRSLPLRCGSNFTTLNFRGPDARQHAESWLVMHGFSFGPPEPALGRRAVIYGDRVLMHALPVWSALSRGALFEIDGIIRDHADRIEVEIFADATPDAIAVALGRDILRVAA